MPEFHPVIRRRRGLGTRITCSRVGLFAILAAAALFIAAARWLVGLSLLRKDVNRDCMTEPGPPPYPETPLGE